MYGTYEDGGQLYNDRFIETLPASKAEIIPVPTLKFFTQIFAQLKKQVKQKKQYFLLFKRLLFVPLAYTACTPRQIRIQLVHNFIFFPSPPSPSAVPHSSLLVNVAPIYNIHPCTACFVPQSYHASVQPKFLCPCVIPPWFKQPILEQRQQPEIRVRCDHNRLSVSIMAGCVSGGGSSDTPKQSQPDTVSFR